MAGTWSDKQDTLVARSDFTVEGPQMESWENPASVRAAGGAVLSR